MAGNSWQQPVAGEPSVGSLHLITPVQVDTRDPTGSGYVVIDCSAYIPQGALVGYFSLQATATAVPNPAALYRATSDTSVCYIIARTMVANSANTVFGNVGLTSNRTVAVYSPSSALSNITTTLMGYYI